MTRRLLLQGLLLGFWSRAAAAAHRLSSRRHSTERQVAEGSKPPAPETIGLAPTEIESLVGFGEVLVVGRILSSAERDDLVEHIVDSAQGDPDTLALFRATAALLDRLAGGSFARLEIAERIALVSHHRLDVRGAPSDRELAHLGADAKAVREKVVPELIHGYWSSPAGWTAVAYATFPGRCGDLARYTRPEV